MYQKLIFTFKSSITFNQNENKNISLSGYAVQLKNTFKFSPLHRYSPTPVWSRLLPQFFTPLKTVKSKNLRKFLSPTSRLISTNKICNPNTLLVVICKETDTEEKESERLINELPRPGAFFPIRKPIFCKIIKHKTYPI